MKNSTFLLFVLTTITVSCDGFESKSASRTVLSFIPGTYVRVFEGEYSKGHDTLIINQPDEKNNYYIIEHNSSFQKIREGRLLPVEYMSETWIAVYNEKDKVLAEQKKGKLISFLPEKEELLLGSDVFNKLNNK
jgi:hypothetical protein